jgi:hypothetical protein
MMLKVTCTWVRQQLAVYRLEDSDSPDRALVTRHLATCHSCQEAQADFRLSGDFIRQLPTIVPPPAFRDSVFAAIRGEALRQAPTLAQISRAVTNPELPAISAETFKHPRPVRSGTTLAGRAAGRHVRVRVSLVAAAAVLLISLLGARLISLIGTSALGNSATNLGTAGLPRIMRYPLEGRFALPTSAMANASWLVYTAANDSHQTMIFAENRLTKRTVQLLQVASSSALSVRALTDYWVIWSTGDGVSSSPWRVYASALATAGNTPPIVLVDSSATTPTTPATLGGIWADGDTVLLAAAPRSGPGEVLKFDLSRGVPAATLISHGQTAGDILTDPSFDDGSYYWADVWFDSTSGLHSSIWKGNGQGANQEISYDQTSFHPQVEGSTLVYVDVAAAGPQQTATTTGAATPDTDIKILYSLEGVLDVRNLGTGRQAPVSNDAEVPTVELGGTVLLWQNGSALHAYDVNTRQPLPVDTKLQLATFAGVNGSSLVWAKSSDEEIFVYDAA